MNLVHQMKIFLYLIFPKTKNRETKGKTTTNKQKTKRQKPEIVEINQPDNIHSIKSTQRRDSN